MKKLLVLGLLVAISISGCFSTPAREVTNICTLLDEKVSWYRAAKLSEEKWKVPMHLQMRSSIKSRALLQELSHLVIRFSDLYRALDQQILMDTLKPKRQHGSGINLKLEKKMQEGITSLMP